MKKTVLTLALLLMAFAAGAQTIQVDFHKGDVRRYSTKNDMSFGVPMGGEQKGSAQSVTTYTVTDATPDGYVVELKADSFSTNGNADVIQQMGNAEFYGAIKDKPARLKLDKNGQIVDLLNADEVLISASKIAIAAVDELYKNHPEIEKSVPKSNALLAVNAQMTKENALTFFKEVSVFELNGKDYQANPQAEENLFGKFKAKSDYAVSESDGNIVINKTSTSNMNEDDAKAFLKEQVGKMSGSELSDAEFNGMWSQLKTMGMTRITINGNNTSTFGKAGWLNSANKSFSIKAMGATIKFDTTTTQL